MNNLIPSHVHMHEKYDLKGSTYKRRANNQERQKESPTWKDLDFMERHPNGLLLDPQTFTALSSTVARDCRVRIPFRRQFLLNNFSPRSRSGFGKFSDHGLFISHWCSSGRCVVGIHSGKRSMISRDFD